MKESYSIHGKKVTKAEYIEHTKKHTPKAKWWACPKMDEVEVNPMACMFCPFGHMTECHYPDPCDPEVCDHAAQELENGY